MATCPRCFGPLTEEHKCPYGARQRVLEVLTTVLAGSLVGAVAILVINEEAPTATVVAAAALGAVVAWALRQAIGRRP